MSGFPLLQAPVISKGTPLVLELRGNGERFVGRQATSNQQSYVYLFVHATENRFKIGKGKSPLDRLAQLPEAEQIDRTQSLRVALPDRLRAGQIESLLHKGLAGYRLQLSWMSASGMLRARSQPWDGATEWFSLAGLRHAIELLRAVPGVNDAEGQLLQTLDGQPYWLDRRDDHLSQHEQRRHDAGRYNLGRLDHICDVLMQIKRHLKICWTQSNDPQASAGILRIKALKQWWTMENLAPRLVLTSHELWALKTGKTPGKPDSARAFTPPGRVSGGHHAMNIYPLQLEVLQINAQLEKPTSEPAPYQTTKALELYFDTLVKWGDER